MRKKFLFGLYLALVAIVCLVPSVGMLCGGGTSDSSDSDSVAAPSLKTSKGAFNINILSDAGDYFESHIALRNLLISADSAIDENVFGVSSQSGDGGVIVGQNNWLYYADSLDDYLGTNQMTDRALFDVARQMKQMQSYAELNGANFAFTIAPNKNSLYGGFMPYYYKNAKVIDTGNYERIQKYLDEEEVNYVPLFDLLYNQDEVLYHARDSHWNNKGAALVTDAVLDSVNQPHKDYSDVSYTVRKDYTGDLDKMLYPDTAQPEDEIYYDGGQDYEYLTEVESNFDPKIETDSEAGEGSLIMYRDSFGNSLLPFFAEAYVDAYFSRGVPYQLSTDLMTHDADTVVVERAERFLPDMAANAPMIPSREAADSVLEGAKAVVAFDAKVSEPNDLYIQLTASIDNGDLKDDSLIYVETEDGLIYEATPTCIDGQEGFSLLIDAEDASSDPGTYTVYVTQ